LYLQGATTCCICFIAAGRHDLQDIVNTSSHKLLSAQGSMSFLLEAIVSRPWLRSGEIFQHEILEDSIVSC